MKVGIWDELSCKCAFVVSSLLWLLLLFLLLLSLLCRCRCQCHCRFGRCPCCCCCCCCSCCCCCCFFVVVVVVVLAVVLIVAVVVLVVVVDVLLVVVLFVPETVKAAQNPLFLTLLTWKCASRHNRVHFFDIEWPSDRPKVVRTRRVLALFTWKCASCCNGVHFFHISTSKIVPKMVCFAIFDSKCVITQKTEQSNLDFIFLNRLSDCIMDRSVGRVSAQVRNGVGGGRAEKGLGSGLERYWGNWESGEGKNYLFIFIFQ